MSTVHPPNPAQDFNEWGKNIYKQLYGENVQLHKKEEPPDPYQPLAELAVQLTYSEHERISISEFINQVKREI